MYSIWLCKMRYSSIWNHFFKLCGKARIYSCLYHRCQQSSLEVIFEFYNFPSFFPNSLGARSAVSFECWYCFSCCVLRWIRWAGLVHSFLWVNITVRKCGVKRAAAWVSIVFRLRAAHIRNKYRCAESHLCVFWRLSGQFCPIPVFLHYKAE